MKSKPELRTQLQQQRAAMPMSEVVTKSKTITEALHVVLGRLTFNSLHCYEPIAKLHEVDVSELFDSTDWQLFTSRKQGDAWQVVSLAGGKPTPDAPLDVIIVPMLGFDKQLHRLGYGGGYYDQLLARHPDAVKIGVCYENGRLAALPSEAHDIPMNLIVTDEAVAIGVT